MNSIKTKARIAGMWYLFMAITAPLGLLYVPSALVIPGDAAATVKNILMSESLFRIGIVSSLISQASFVFLVLALDRLFNGVNARYSKLMVSLVIAAVPIAILNELFHIAVLHLLSGAEYLKVFESNQLNALVMTLLNLHEQGTVIAGIFWGLWLYPFGRLVIESRFIPKILGILLIVGCFSYLADSFSALIFPRYRDLVTSILILPLAAGEILTILWLLIKGAKKQKTD